MAPIAATRTDRLFSGAKHLQMLHTYLQEIIYTLGIYFALSALYMICFRWMVIYELTSNTLIRSPRPQVVLFLFPIPQSSNTAMQGCVLFHPVHHAHNCAAIGIFRPQTIRNDPWGAQHNQPA